MSNDITLLDGGMGKTLERNGAPFRQPEWSALALIEDPDHVRTAHQQFVEAGADVITTNNYAIVPFHIGQERFEREGVALTALSASLAREAAAGGTQVAGSIPPLFGSYEPDKFDAKFAPSYLGRIVDSLAPNVDFFLAETQSSVEEASFSMRAAGNYDLPIWVSFSLDDDQTQEAVLRSGESLEAAVDAAVAGNAEAVLFNCSHPEILSMAIPRAVEQAQGGFAVGGYANAFLPKPQNYSANEVVLGHREDLDPTGYLEFVKEWIDAGATVVGGCCGIMPEHIAAMRAHLDSRNGIE